MEAGARWMLNDVAGKPIRAWDSRGHTFRTEYDPLRRPLRSFVTGADPANPNQELLTERLVYGEQHPEAELRNLRGKLYLHLDQAGVGHHRSPRLQGQPAARLAPDRHGVQAGARLEHGRRGAACQRHGAARPRRARSGPRAAAGSRHLHQPHHLRRAQPPGHADHAAQRPADAAQRHPARLQRGQPAGAGGLAEPARARRSLERPAGVRRPSSPTSTTTPRASASASTTATAPAPSTTTTRSPSA